VINRFSESIVTEDIKPVTTRSKVCFPEDRP
jgi:hypothetical protein